MGGIVAAINSDLFLPWVESGGFADNVGEGIAFAVVGLVGSMVTAYYAAGGFLPSTSGKAEYEALEFERADLRERFDASMAIATDEADVAAERRDAALKSAEVLKQRLDAVTSEAAALKRSILGRALPFYLLIGSAFAVMFAENLAQALLIGFAWTLLAERFGMKNEQETKEKVRKDDIEKIEREAKAGERHRKEAIEAKAEARAKQEKLDATETALKTISDEFARVAAGGAAASDGTGENGAKPGKPSKKQRKKAKAGKK